MKTFHNFSKGFASPFQAMRFIRTNRSLIKYILIPTSINLIVFSLAVYLGLHFFEEFVMHRIPQGEAWYWLILNYFLWTVAIALTAILVFFSFAVAGSLLASPFNDILSEQTEHILAGSSIDESFSLALFLQDARHTLIDESKKIVLFICCMALLLLLHFIPVLGSLFYSVGSMLLTIFFLVIEFTGYTFSRKHLLFRDQRRFILNNKLMLFGFGLGILCILAIPFSSFYAFLWG